MVAAQILRRIDPHPPPKAASGRGKPLLPLAPTLGPPVSAMPLRPGQRWQGAKPDACAGMDAATRSCCSRIPRNAAESGSIATGSQSPRGGGWPQSAPTAVRPGRCDPAPNRRFRVPPDKAPALAANLAGENSGHASRQFGSPSPRALALHVLWDVARGVFPVRFASRQCSCGACSTITVGSLWPR